MKNILKKVVLWIDNNGWTLFIVLGWIFPILVCLLPENVVPFFFPLMFWSAVAIIISVLYFAAGMVTLFDDLWKKIVEKCKN